MRKVNIYYPKRKKENSNLEKNNICVYASKQKKRASKKGIYEY